MLDVWDTGMTDPVAVPCPNLLHVLQQAAVQVRALAVQLSQQLPKEATVQLLRGVRGAAHLAGDRQHIRTGALFRMEMLQLGWIWVWLLLAIYLHFSW